MRCYHPAYGTVPMLVPAHEFWVIALQPYLVTRLRRLLPHNPLRESSPAPFRADVRSRTDNHIQPILLRHSQEIFQLGHIQTRIIFRRTGHLTFVPVPRDVGLYTIETGIFQLLETVCPQGLRHPEIMESTAKHKHILSFYLDAPVIKPDAVRMNKHRIVYRRPSALHQLIAS